ncbi:helix-turn-helix domain-containing protein [Staphylococcus equorum]|uniref:helix-turn-helix domain-containing protein n=1 Tax=Staphylococcus equorum TaxID=246432 RepID=UPI001867EA7F|nr:helix-turn-helix domain-containing protein [Staphylococcus equorum]MDG0826446.1 helix-turn-helix domain-containing protein [Staphylococcus equorum]
MPKQLEVYTANDIAQLLDLSIDTVRTYIKRGDLKASKVGRKYIITNDNYKAFIKAHEVQI